MFDALDAVAGRLMFRVIGLMATLLALAAAYAVYSTLTHGSGLEAFVVAAMFAGGAVMAGYTALLCFSHRRTLEEFLYAVDDGEPGQ